MGSSMPDSDSVSEARSGGTEVCVLDSGIADDIWVSWRLAASH
jgi:hypothetical protein